MITIEQIRMEIRHHWPWKQPHFIDQLFFLVYQRNRHFLWNNITGEKGRGNTSIYVEHNQQRERNGQMTSFASLMAHCFWRQWLNREFASMLLVLPVPYSAILSMICCLASWVMGALLAPVRIWVHLSRMLSGAPYKWVNRNKYWVKYYNLLYSPVKNCTRVLRSNAQASLTVPFYITERFVEIRPYPP